MSESLVEVRPARPGDAGRVFDLLRQFAMSYRPSRDAFDRHFPRLLEDGNADLLVACLNDEVIGYALAFRLLTLFANGPIAELQELMVDPAHRGRGIGRRLVAAVEKRAWEAGCVEVTVPTRRAGPYYQQLGYEETASYFKKRRDGSGP